MALIDFKCENCKDEFFEIVYGTALEEVKCPKCGSVAKRIYKGKFYGKACEGGVSKGCSGSCGGCSGCR